jgi:hypothetical protein
MNLSCQYLESELSLDCLSIRIIKRTTEKIQVHPRIVWNHNTQEIHHILLGDTTRNIDDTLGGGCGGTEKSALATVSCFKIPIWHCLEGSFHAHRLNSPSSWCMLKDLEIRNINRTASAWRGKREGNTLTTIDAG